MLHTVRMVSLVLCILLALSLTVGAADTTSADSVLIIKSEHKMILYSRGKPIHTYSVALGTGGLDPKQHQGDHLTPEGLYTVDGRNPASQFYKALHLSYPSPVDRERARRLGKSPGGDVEIHGLPKKYAWVGAAHRATDWTDGCIAVTNAEMDEIWKLVPAGTPVEIRRVADHANK